MAGKMSKTNVSARRENREANKKTCKYCGQEQDIVMAVVGRGKTKMIRRCCEKAGISSEAAG